MSSARKTPGNERQSWKGRWKEVDPRPARRVRRVVGTIIALGLLAVFAWMLWPRSDTTTCVFYGAIGDYEVWQAPPLAFAAETSNNFEALRLRKASAPWKVTFNELPWVASHGPLKSAVFDHEIANLSSETGVVIVYLAGQGICLGEDETDAAVILEDKSGAVPLKKLLQQLHDCRGHIKLLALDAGSIESDPVRGIVVNEFPTLVKKAIDDLGYKDVWVLLSHQQFEKSHAAFDEHRSVFGYYVARGLSGQADLEGDDDRTVELAELGDYVRGRVYAYVSAVHKQNQRPFLYPSGSGNASIALMPRSEPDARPIEHAADNDDKGEKSGEAETKPKGEASRSDRWPSLADLAYPNRSMRVSALAAQAPPAEGKSEAERKAKSTQPSDSSTAAPAKSGTPPFDEEKPDVVKPAAVPPDTSSKKSQDSDEAEAPGAAHPAADGTKGQSKVVSDEERMLDLVVQELSACLKRSRVSESDMRWTPVDYAPRFWLEHIEFLRRYESRCLLGSTDKLQKRITEQIDERRDQVGEADNSGTDWRTFDEKSRAGLERDDRLRAAIQLRNDLLFKLRYYVAWSTDKEGAAAKIENLIDAVRGLLKALNNDQARESDSDRWLNELSAKRREIQRQIAALDRLWETDLEDCLDQPRGHATADFERLLELPWLPAEKRRNLWSALSASRLSLEGNDDRLSKSGPPQVPASDDRASWKNARQGAVLQLKLLRLALSDAEIDDLIGKLERQTTPDPDLAREVGAKVRTAYRELDEISIAKSPEQDQRLRLAHPHDSRTNRTLFLARAFFNVDLDWKLSLEPHIPEQAILKINVDTDVRFAIKVSGTPPSALKADWSLAGYKTDLIELSDQDKRTGSVELGTDGWRKDVTFHVRAKKETKGEVALRLNVKVDDQHVAESERIVLTLPQQKAIELVVYDDHEEKKGRRRISDPTERAKLSWIKLRPYATQTTKFRLTLYNPSQLERKVTYQFFALDKKDLSIDEWRTWPLTDQGELTSHRKPIHEVPNVSLPAGKEVNLCLPPLPKPAAPAGATAPPAKPDTPPDKQEKIDIGDGLVCKVTDVTELASGEITYFWIDLAPLHPRSYVVPDVSFYRQANDMIKASVTPKDNMPQRDETKMTCRIEGSTDEPQTVTQPKGQRLEMDLTVTSTSARGEWTRVEIDVDDYPRAFRFEVRPISLGKKDMEKSDVRVDFELPKQRAWHKKGKPCAAVLRVDVPPDWFPDWFNADNFLLLGIPDPPAKQRVFMSDRRLVANLLPAEKEGDLAVACEVKDLETDFETKGYPDKDIKLVATLNGTEATASRTIQLDSRPPRIEADPLQEGTTGQDMTLKFTVTDQRDGGAPGEVAKVQVDLATDSKLQMKEPQELAPVNEGVYEWVIPADKIKGPGTLTALVTATDMAGNQRENVPIRFRINPAPPKPVAAAAGGNMPIKVQGTVTFRGEIAQNFKVTGQGPAAVPPRNTGSNGKFEMSLPPGKYKLTFSGVVQARKAEFTKELTVPQGAAGLLEPAFDGP